MKFTNDHLIRLKAAIDHLLRKHPNVVSDYEHGRIQYADKVKCIQTRFCFDLLYASGLKIGDGVGIVGDINGNYNDAHILTALKSVCPKIVKKY